MTVWNRDLVDIAFLLILFANYLEGSLLYIDLLKTASTASDSLVESILWDRDEVFRAL